MGSKRIKQSRLFIKTNGRRKGDRYYDQRMLGKKYKRLFGGICGAMSWKQIARATGSGIQKNKKTLDEKFAGIAEKIGSLVKGGK